MKIHRYTQFSRGSRFELYRERDRVLTRSRENPTFYRLRRMHTAKVMRVEEARQSDPMTESTEQKCTREYARENIAYTLSFLLRLT